MNFLKNILTTKVNKMENFHKYLKIRTLGHDENKDIFLDPEDEICTQEKFDGCNLRYTFLDTNIIFGSRTQQLTSDIGEDTNVAKNFRRCLDYIREKVSKLSQEYIKGMNGFIFYGECMVKHSIEYNWEVIPPFIGFDIYKIKDGVLLRWDIAQAIFHEMGFTFANIINVCKAKDIKTISEDDVPISKYPPLSNPTQKAEGIVLKNSSKQIYAKFVRTEFKEINANTFGGSPKYEESDTGKFCASYCTNPRIDKIIFKLLDEGHELDLPLMKYLPTQVYRDIMEEHGEDLLYSKKTIDFRKIKDIVTKRCLSVLRQVITNNSFNPIYKK